MEGLISNILNTLQNKNDLKDTDNKKLHKKLIEKVDKAAKLYLKNKEQNQSYLFSVYYTHFINEALDEM